MIKSKDVDLDAVRTQVQQIQTIAGELYESSEDLPFLNRNVKRILASVKMLEINLEDASKTDSLLNR
jgi:hypothetical protein